MTTKYRKRLIREGLIRESSPPVPTPATGPGLTLLRSVGLRTASAQLAEAGRVLSAANEEKLKTAQAAIADVLAALEAPEETTEAADPEAKCPTCEGEGKIREGNVDCPDCGGSGLAKDVKKEARRARISRLAEAYSSSANDAADGAYILSLLLDLMGEESDEPDELPILQMAFTALSSWLAIEVAEIGGPEDVADSSGGGWDLWGWESARKRLAASGGPIKVPEGIRLLREAKPLRTDLVAISESAIAEDGTGSIKIIAPGWGSSGYYAPEVLERDGPTVFAAGTKMFWDHPTLTEEWERPERSLRDLAGETTTAAVWQPNGEAGPGLYAKTKVFENFAPVVNELAPSIGVSIRAYGKATIGEAEGKTGTIIEELVDVESIDFVTFPGAGGQVLQLFEAARQRILPTPTLPKETGDMEVEKDPRFIEERAGRQRAEEALVLIEAEKVVTAKLAEAQLPDVTRTRLVASLAVNPPAKDGKLDKPALEARIDEAVLAEKEYLAKLTGAGQIRGMGVRISTGDEDGKPALKEAFKSLGMSDEKAEIAATGRTR